MNDTIKVVGKHCRFRRIRIRIIIIDVHTLNYIKKKIEFMIPFDTDAPTFSLILPTLDLWRIQISGDAAS